MTRAPTDNMSFTASDATLAFDLSTSDTIFEARDAATWDDATWILTSAFIIFTMQSGRLYIHTLYVHVIMCKNNMYTYTSMPLFSMFGVYCLLILLLILRTKQKIHYFLSFYDFVVVSCHSYSAVRFFFFVVCSDIDVSLSHRCRKFLSHFSASA